MPGQLPTLPWEGAQGTVTFLCRHLHTKYWTCSCSVTGVLLCIFKDSCSKAWKTNTCDGYDTYFLNSTNLPMVGIAQSNKKLFRLFTYSTTSECLGLLNAQAKLWINQNPKCKSVFPQIILITSLQIFRAYCGKTIFGNTCFPKVTWWWYKPSPPSRTGYKYCSLLHLCFFLPQVSLNTIMTVVVVGLTLIICKIWGFWIVLALDLTLSFWSLQCWDAMNKVNFACNFGVILCKSVQFFLKCKSN